MRNVNAISATILLLLFGGAAIANAQHDQGSERDKSKPAAFRSTRGR